MSTLEIGRLTPDMADEFQTMTFPAYRHLLSLQPAPRHPDQGDTRPILPVASMARVDGAPAGLVLVEVSGVDKAPELLSLQVAPEYRNRGIGTALVEHIEGRIARQFGRLETVYMTGKPGIDAFERVLVKRGWDAPVARTMTVRFTLDEAARTPWFGRVRLAPPDFEIFAWTDLKPAERVRLETSNTEKPWIAVGLEPWRHVRYGFEPVSSVGLRYRGEVVGWVINHRASAEMVRFTCSFMRDDLSRRGRILGLYTESLNRLRAASACRVCSLITPMSYGPMIEFLRWRCADWVSFVGETRGAGKALAGHAAASVAQPDVAEEAGTAADAASGTAARPQAAASAAEGARA